MAECHKMKKLDKSEDRERIKVKTERDQRLSEFMCRVYRPRSTNAERSQDLSLIQWKRKFKSDLGIREIYIKLLGMNVRQNNVCQVIE